MPATIPPDSGGESYGMPSLESMVKRKGKFLVRRTKMAVVNREK